MNKNVLFFFWSGLGDAKIGYLQSCFIRVRWGESSQIMEKKRMARTCRVGKVEGWLSSQIMEKKRGRGHMSGGWGK